MLYYFQTFNFFYTVDSFLANLPTNFNYYNKKKTHVSIIIIILSRRHTHSHIVFVKIPSCISHNFIYSPQCHNNFILCFIQITHYIKNVTKLYHGSMFPFIYQDNSCLSQHSCLGRSYDFDIGANFRIWEYLMYILFSNFNRWSNLIIY